MQLTGHTRRVILELGKLRIKKIKVNITLLRKKTGTTISHINKIINELERIKIIQSEKEPKKRNLYLTSNGWKTFYCLRLLKELELE